MNTQRLTVPEREVVNRVQKQNFFGRVLPLSIGSMMTVHFLIRRGMISSNRQYLKGFGAGVVGYIMGKISLPNQMKGELLRQCPEGNFAKMNSIYERLSPEERKAFVLEMYKNDNLQGQTNQTPSMPTTGTESSTENPLFMGSPGSTGSLPGQEPAKGAQPTFSYAEQRSKNNTEQGIPQSLRSSQQPEFSYAQQRVLNSGGNTQQMPTIPQDTQPPQPTGLSGSRSGSGSRVKRNSYGDEME